MILKRLKLIGKLLGFAIRRLVAIPSQRKPTAPSAKLALGDLFDNARRGVRRVRQLLAQKLN
jgi:hypothetical protein